MSYKIVDTTLRDGEQRPGLSFNMNQKLNLAKYIDSLGVYQIEAGVPAMKGEEKESVWQICQLGLNCKVSAWNRLSVGDIKESMECGVDIIHISAPASRIQISKKLKRDENWVLDKLKECIFYCLERNFQVSIGLEDASRAEENFLISLCDLANSMKVRQIRYADTVGILTPKKTYEIIKGLTEGTNIDLEFHGHNDFGMAEANTLASIAAGAKYVDCTLNGIGERSGNCDYNKLILNMDLV
ncbi:homocitrate synthase [Clostridium sp. 19966]|uniref:homocitrate synthase n=1 Tax=Clostridium sp. 19966 TaxID=2768166 RepID=UPI0028E08017|nr:homocitrate synthase [Clostridium sp. 19966]MDT8717429.1 homocitrate synthase [Clostridium sp. 19966]